MGPDGWQWLIFSHLVEKQWPMLPSMLQGALNSANAISKAANELELAAQLANLFQHGVPLKEAKSKVQASTTVEPQLLANLCYFITHYAGGDTFPFIDFLQKFSALPVFVPFGITPKPCGITCVINVCGCPGRNFNIQLQAGHESIHGSNIPLGLMIPNSKNASSHFGGSRAPRKTPTWKWAPSPMVPSKYHASRIPSPWLPMSFCSSSTRRQRTPKRTFLPKGAKAAHLRREGPLD